MPSLLLNRRRGLGAGVALLALIGVGVWYFDPDRSLDRAWRHLVSAVESRKTQRLAAVLAADYSDRWGYGRDTLLADARAAFFQFRRLVLTVEQVAVQRADARGVVTAVLRMDADGYGEVADARATVNGLFTPFRFEWRREPDFPWAWKLTTFDHPELALRRFGASR